MKQKFVLRPPIKTAGLPAALPYGQQIELFHNGQLVGTARWHAPEGADGVIQIADLHIADGHRRQGHGSTLLKKVYAEAAELFAALNIKPRRCWLLIEQKRHVIARAFLSRHGYQHVSTLEAIFRGQDGMLYQKAFD